MSSSSQSLHEQQNTQPSGNPALQWIAVVALVYLLVCAVGMIGSGFKGASGGKAKELFAFATNPFMGLVIGTVATALGCGY